MAVLLLIGRQSAAVLLIFINIITIAKENTFKKNKLLLNSFYLCKSLETFKPMCKIHMLKEISLTLEVFFS